jgi:hypothetical protein
MRRRVAGFPLQAILLAVLCQAQTLGPVVPSRFIEIQVPPGVPSETLFIRYALKGADFNSWVPPRTGVASYIVHTTANGRAATGIRAILHAPGCAIRTLDLALSEWDNPRYAFTCQPIRTIPIQGALSGRPYGAGMTVQARYVARWAQRFLGLDDTIATGFPVGDAADLPVDGHFRLDVPDLSQDPLAGAPDHAGELRIYARNKISGLPVAQLIPTDLQIAKTKTGGFAAQREYPSEIVFAPQPANCAPLHDSEGFAIRQDGWDACNR